MTQSFNTTTSMGRLTLNILLSFAQFEREVTAERIRDKVRASRMKGMWMGGCPPLGYEIKARKLVENPGDAEHVRWVFNRFIEIGSGTMLARELAERGVTTSRGHLIVGIWSNEVAQNNLRNAIDDYFFDVLRDTMQIELPMEQLDDLEQRIMDLARARFVA